MLKSHRRRGNRYEKTFQTLYLSGQPILKLNKQNQAIYTVQQPIKIHLHSAILKQFINTERNAHHTPHLIIIVYERNYTVFVS